jgi:hypothetical protein
LRSSGDRGVMVGEAGLQTMEHAAELCQLPMDAHCLQAHTANALPFVGRLLVHNMILSLVEFIT